MAVEWSGSGPDMLLRVDRRAREPLGVQLQNELREAVRTGRLQTGERLPSSRKLAGALGLSRGLVQSAYEQLEAEGYLRAIRGSATRVAPIPRPADDEAPEPVSRSLMSIDFAPGRPDLHSFPMRDWLWALGEAGRSASSTDVGYGDPRGLTRPRQVIASYVRRVRGLSAHPDDVVICSGFTQGAGLTLSALRARGVTSVAIEDPGHLDIAGLIRRAGLRPIPVTVDEHGIVVEELAGTDASAVFVTPAHQTPTGVVLSPERRQQLLGWAERNDGIVIEDDYDSEFRYDRQPVGSLQGLAPHRVVNIGSVSKPLCPGLRLGWLLAPQPITEPIAEAKEYHDRGSPALDQLALAHLMESGRFDRHLRRMRHVYAARCTALVGALGRHAPDLAVTGLAAGFHAVAALPVGSDEAGIVRAAAERSVGIQGLGRYRSPERRATGTPGIVFGFGDVNENRISRGIALIGDLLAST
jgi:GntR family transcriptional regulator/MocR family aminotransferase